MYNLPEKPVQNPSIPMQPTRSDSSFPTGRRKWLLAIGIAIVVIGGVSVFLWNSNRTAERNEALRLAHSGAIDQAIPALVQCLEDDPNNAELLKELVTCLISTESDPSDVEPYCRRWCEVRPNDAEPFQIRFSMLKRLSRQLEAIEVGERLLTLAPFDDLSRKELVLMYFEVGRYDDARRECLRLRDSSAVPQDFVLVTLGHVELKRGDLLAAARITDELLTRMPNESVPQLLRGLIHLEAGEHVQAITVLRRIRSRDRRERISILHALGLALSRSGQEEEANKNYRELARITDADLYVTDAAQRKSDAKFQMRAANALYAIDDFDDASRILEALHQHAPADRESMTLLAKCHAGMGRTELARATQERASRLPEPSKPRE